MNVFDNFTDKDLYELMMDFFQWKYDYDYLGNRKTKRWISYKDNTMIRGSDDKFLSGFYSSVNNLEFFCTIEDLEKVFKDRELEMPLHVIPAPKTLIILPLEVKEKKTSKIFLPDTVKTTDNMEKYKDHPTQAVVVAMDKSIEWEGLYIGCVCFLKSSAADIFRFNDVSYRFISYSSIIAVI